MNKRYLLSFLTLIALAGPVRIEPTPTEWTSIEPESNTRKDAGLRIRATGALVLRHGLVLVIGWIGLMKFTGYEAKGIEPLVAHSPFMSWMYTSLAECCRTAV